MARLQDGADAWGEHGLRGINGLRGCLGERPGQDGKIARWGCRLGKGHTTIEGGFDGNDFGAEVLM